jgi:hypothetical protein
MCKDTAEADEAAVLRKPQTNPAALQHERPDIVFSPGRDHLPLADAFDAKGDQFSFPRLPHTIGDRHIMAALGCTNAVCTVA